MYWAMADCAVDLGGTRLTARGIGDSTPSGLVLHPPGRFGPLGSKRGLPAVNPGSVREGGAVARNHGEGQGDGMSRELLQSEGPGDRRRGRWLGWLGGAVALLALLGGLGGGDMAIAPPLPIGSVGLWLLFGLGTALATFAFRVPAGREVAAVGITDAVSGLYVEGHGDELVSRLVARDDRAGRSATMLVVIRVDFLEQLIARYGKDVIDIVVHAVGHQIRDQIRTTDIAVQVPGYRFGIYLHCGEMEQAQAFCRRIAMLLQSRQIPWQGDELKLAISMVIAARVPGEPLGQLKQRALLRLDRFGADPGRIEVCAAPNIEPGSLSPAGAGQDA